MLIDDPHRFDGVAVVGVDEHAWRHTRRGDKYVTVVIDLTAVRAGSGPARLLDMVEGRSRPGEVLSLEVVDVDHGHGAQPEDRTQARQLTLPQDRPSQLPLHLTVADAVALLAG